MGKLQEMVSKVFHKEIVTNEFDDYLLDDILSIIKQYGNKLPRSAVKLKLQTFLIEECDAELKELSQEYVGEYRDYEAQKVNLVGLLDTYQTSCNELDKLGNEFIVDYSKDISNPYDDLIQGVQNSVAELPIILSHINLSLLEYIKEQNGN
jgi:hypothetical protein